MGESTAAVSAKNILEFSAYYHDGAAALLKDGNLAAAVQQERFSRKDMTPGFLVKRYVAVLKRGARSQREGLPNPEHKEPQGKTGETFLMPDILADLWAFMGERKKFWLAPIILVMILLGALIVFAQGSSLAPFIYTLF